MLRLKWPAPFLGARQQGQSSRSGSVKIFRQQQQVLLPAMLALSTFLSAALCMPATAQPTLPEAAEPSVPYTVVAGDKLIVLGSSLLRQPSDWPEVARFNRLKNPNLIRPGQTLQIPVRLMKPVPVAGKVLSTYGDVQIDGSPVEAGAVLNEGARLKTGANSSAVIELADGSRVTLLPNTLAELATSRGYLARGTESGAATTWFSGLIRLVQGALDAMAARLANRATPLQIQTPTSLVGVRGTQFRVAFDDPATQNARTEVLEGAVRLDNTAQGSGAPLAAGKGAVLNPQVREIRIVDLLKAPDLSGTPADIIKPLARWPMPALEAAARFRVQIAADESFGKIVRDQVVTSGAADFADLPNGAWFARVRGIDAGGLEGYDSIKAVQVLLPPPPELPPRQWTISNDRIDLNNGRHILRFSQQGLDASHTIRAVVSAEGGSSAPLAEATARGDRAAIEFDLGYLEPGAPILLRLTVVQADGAKVVPLTYRFNALSGWGWAEGVLQLVTP
jgi:LysM repeat protein